MNVKICLKIQLHRSPNPQTVSVAYNYKSLRMKTYAYSSAMLRIQIVQFSVITPVPLVHNVLKRHSNI